MRVTDHELREWWKHIRSVEGDTPESQWGRAVLDLIELRAATREVLVDVEFNPKHRTLNEKRLRRLYHALAVKDFVPRTPPT
jgi:hypothetical protein